MNFSDSVCIVHVMTQIGSLHDVQAIFLSFNQSPTMLHNKHPCQGVVMNCHSLTIMAWILICMLAIHTQYKPVSAHRRQRVWGIPMDIKSHPIIIPMTRPLCYANSYLSSNSADIAKHVSFKLKFHTTMAHQQHICIYIYIHIHYVTHSEEPPPWINISLVILYTLAWNTGRLLIITPY